MISIKDFVKKWGGLLLLTLLGAILILAPWDNLDDLAQNKINESLDWRLLEQELARELEDYLQRLCNARTHVMIHLSTLEYNEFWQGGSSSSKNSSEEGGSGTRSTSESSSNYAVQMMRTGGNESPLIVRRWMPMIAGVAIVIERQSDPVLTDQVVRSISTLYQIGSHKISVEYAQLR